MGYLKKFLFRVSRIKMLGMFVGFVFTHFPFLIPIRKIEQTKKAVSMPHPVAVYPNHVLIVLRKLARTIFYLSADDFVEVIEMAIKIRHGDDRDFVLWINGGNRQDVMQAHFHLFTGNMIVEKGLSKNAERTFLPSDKGFWEYTVTNMSSLLKENGASESSFSMFIQFAKGENPSVYFV